MNNHVRINIHKHMFSDKNFCLLENKNFKVELLKYESGIEGIFVSNNILEFVILPYMGFQIWKFKYKGNDLTQKSIFDYPLNNKKFGDNYGGFLYHCGLTNINAAEEGENYPLHGELPFAEFRNNYIEINSEEIIIRGEFIYKNSQDYYYSYKPIIKLEKDSSLVKLTNSIKNHRLNSLNYLSMIHMNWLTIENSKLYYTANEDGVKAEVVEAWDDTERVKLLSDISKDISKNPQITNTIDEKTRLLNPEYCINIKYKSDKKGMAHSIMELPNKESYYVSFNNEILPFGLRWFCRTGDEDGIGFCCPTTGNNRSTKYQREHGYFNTLKHNEEHNINYIFGILNAEETEKMKKEIENIKYKI